MNDYLTLSNGKKIYCNGGIIGLSKQDDNYREVWHPNYGWDGGLADATYFPHFSEDDLEYDHITKAEMLEICDIMIARWQDYKKFVLEQKELLVIDKG